jgi:hypothetical protein
MEVRDRSGQPENGGVVRKRSGILTAYEDRRHWQTPSKVTPKFAFEFLNGDPYRELETIRMSVPEWDAIPSNPRQRDEQMRIDKGRVDHLLNLDEVHKKVAMAVLPDGARYKVDGHTRLAVWKAGLAAVPSYLNVDVFVCVDIAAVKQLYDRYDNAAAGELGVDRVTGAYRQAGISPKSPMLAEGGISTAARQLYHYLTQTAPTKQSKDLAINRTVTIFADEIMLLDGCAPTRALFPTGIIMGALLTLASQPRNAVDFWTRYSANSGFKDNGVMDAVQALLERHAKEKGKPNSRRDSIFMGASVAAVYGFSKEKLWSVNSNVIAQKSKEDLRQYANEVVKLKGGI